MGCPSTQVYHDDAYLPEVWALFGVGTVVLFLRMAVRLRTVGWRKLQGDDYMALPVWLCFLCDSVTVTVVYLDGSNLDFTEEKLLQLSDCQLKQVRVGSQMQLLAWYTYTLLLWFLKAMLLFFYFRLTFGLNQQRLVKIFAVVTAVTYLAVFLTISCGCFPIQRNWQVVPRPPKKCTMKLQNFYVTTILNVLTDTIILFIPIPLLWGMKLSLSKKIGLTLLLCSGIFIITAAVMRISFTLAGVNALNINRWGTRETVAGIVAVNLPVLRPLFRVDFWRKGYNPSIGSPNQTTRPTCKQQQHSRIGLSRWFKKKHCHVHSLEDLIRIRNHDIQKGTATNADREGYLESRNFSAAATECKSVECCESNSTDIYCNKSRLGDVELGLTASEIRVETTFDVSSTLPAPPPVALLQLDGEEAVVAASLGEHHLPRGCGFSKETSAGCL